MRLALGRCPAQWQSRIVGPQLRRSLLRPDHRPKRGTRHALAILSGTASLRALYLTISLGVALFTTPVASSGVLGVVFIIPLLLVPSRQELGRATRSGFALLRASPVLSFSLRDLDQLILPLGLSHYLDDLTLVVRP